MARLFTTLQAQFIRENADGKNDAAMCALVNEKYGLSVTQKQMSNWRGNHNARSSVPLHGWKKDKKADIDFKRPTHKNRRFPVGSEGISKGVVTVKVAEGRWISKHKFLYEKANGEVPKNHVVIFADGNNRNFDLDNLILIKRKHLAILNKKKMYIKDGELLEMALNYAKLVEGITDKRKDMIAND